MSKYTIGVDFGTNPAGLSWSMSPMAGKSALRSFRIQTVSSMSAFLFQVKNPF